MQELIINLPEGGKFFVLHILRTRIPDGVHDHVVKHMHTTDCILKGDLLVAHERANLATRDYLEDNPLCEPDSLQIYEAYLTELIEELAMDYMLPANRLDAELQALLEGDTAP